ncbi:MULTISPECIES: hypothetical protein [Bacteroidales]|nr:MULTISPECIES: hypothetical protein [Bacteroidales]
MEDTKLTKHDVMDIAVGAGIIFVTGLIAYKLGVDSGKRQYQKTMIRLARKNGEIWRIVDGNHRLTVTYF